METKSLVGACWSFLRLHFEFLKLSALLKPFLDLTDLSIIVLLGLHQDLPGGRPSTTKDYAYGIYIISTFHKIRSFFFFLNNKTHPYFISPGNSRGQQPGSCGNGKGSILQEHGESKAQERITTVPTREIFLHLYFFRCVAGTCPTCLLTLWRRSIISTSKRLSTPSRPPRRWADRSFVTATKHSWRGSWRKCGSHSASTTRFRDSPIPFVL